MECGLIWLQSNISPTKSKFKSSIVCRPPSYYLLATREAKLYSSKTRRVDYNHLFITHST